MEIREASDGLPIIAGYAVVFGAWSDPIMGLFRERVRPGAFTRSLQTGPDVIALNAHDVAQPLGRRSAGTLSVTQDDIGLRVEINPPDTSYARDLIANIKRGDVRGMSFGFDVDEDAWAEGDDGMLERDLISAKLYEVSPVSMPAYPDTSVALRSWAKHRSRLNEQRMRLVMASLRI